VKAIAGGGAELSGKVKGKRCAHEWQCTLDPTDSTGWYKKIIDTTLQAKTTVTGFTFGNTVYFRHRCILMDGPTEWDDVISIHII
jgi:hypothetical protein